MTILTTAKAAVPYPDEDELVSEFHLHTQAVADKLAEIPGIATLTTAERDGLAGGELWTGRVIYNTTTGLVQVYTGTGWQDVTPGSTAYTPQISGVVGELVYGSGAARTGIISRVGKLVHATFDVTFGSTVATAGEGDFDFYLPVATAAALPAGSIVGTGGLRDASSDISQMVYAFADASDTTARLRIAGDNGLVGEGNPWAWANGDRIRLMLTYLGA